ncbi:MAG: hypothetical protein LBL26_03620, partial [Peptococcaceae bacterium]|nr:hypothetical protein [Peptococcaceae bacterium]
MRLLKNKRTIALILTLMMFFSNAAIAMALPEKVQVGTVNGVVEQYDYEDALGTGAARVKFKASIINMRDPESFIIKDDQTGLWYDVNSDITLAGAMNDP